MQVADFGLSRLMPEHGTHLSTLSHGTITHMVSTKAHVQQVKLRVLGNSESESGFSQQVTLSGWVL